MAIPKSTKVIPASGLTVASPTATHGSHEFRSAGNFNTIVSKLVTLVQDHAGSLGNIAYIKEWWEDPAIVGETEQFPCFYILPLYQKESKEQLDETYGALPYIGDPLAKHVIPVTLLGYYKYTDIYHPVSDVRNYAYNFLDILLQDRLNYCPPGGIQAATPHIGWHIAGTNYIILYWSLQLKITSIL